MAENAEQLVEKAKQLEERMEWLIQRSEVPGHVSIKLHVFERIRESFESLVGGERIRLERREEDVKHREEVVRHREGDIESRESSVEGREVAVRATVEVQKELENALATRSEQLLEGEAKLREDQSCLEESKVKLQEDRRSLEEREAALKAAQEALRNESNGLEQGLQQLKSEWVRVEKAKVNLEDEMKNLTLTTGETLSELKSSKDQLQLSWERDLQDHSDRANQLSRELEAAKQDVLASNSRADEAKRALESSYQESKSLLEKAQADTHIEKQRASRFEDSVRELAEAKTLVDEKLSVATEKIAELEAKQVELAAQHEKLASESKSLLEEAEEATRREKKRADDSRRASLDDKASALAAVEKERDSLKSHVRELQGSVETTNQEAIALRTEVQRLKDQAEELEQAKIQLKVQMDKMLEQGDKPANPRKRAFEKDSTDKNSPWRKAVRELVDMLYLCKPVIDDSCTQEQALEAVSKLFASENSRDNLLDFLQSYPCDKWCCIDEVAEEGFGAYPATDTCPRHEGGPCFQIRSGDESGQRRPTTFLCRMK
ncbi:hypothetical protein GL218_08925 [Daldinia childiae]|uniref:uncharacterized protein n=1 Tax=Daldinia childiae TaxID=326645 RepID=UPI0014481A72|nr:uncharacterized protein GL218_08925 [Daldinia childiae]KAF3067029.1 hypothetical protein GL218_08925 [Daldinia childiae]